MCDPEHGSECEGGPDGTETFCFEMYRTNAKYAYYGSDGSPYFDARVSATQLAQVNRVTQSTVRE